MLQKMKSNKSNMSVTSLSNSNVIDNNIMDPRHICRLRKAVDLHLETNDDSNRAVRDADGDKMGTIKQKKNNLPERNVIQVYWSVVETRLEGEEAKERMHSSESSIDSTPDQAMQSSSTTCTEPMNRCRTTDQSETMDCRKNCPGLQESRNSISPKDTNTNLLPGKEGDKEADQGVEECRPESGRSTCPPKDARECQKCIVTNDNKLALSETPSSGMVTDESDVSCYPLPGRTQCLPINICDTCHIEKETKTQDLDAGMEELPCSRPECPGREEGEEEGDAAAIDSTFATAVCAPKAGDDQCDATAKECDDCDPSVDIQKPQNTCVPREGKRKCDDLSPIVCDKCEVSTTHKLFDNEATCNPQPGSDQCDQQTSMYCIQCVGTIKPGLHHGSQSEKVKCYEPYKRECVVCAAAKVGQQTPLNVPLCTPYMTRVHHSGPEGIVCEECMEAAIKSQSMVDVCRPKPGEDQCELTSVVCEECVATAARSEEQPTAPLNAPSNECFPQPGTEACGEEMAKLCEECLREADSLPNPEPKHSTLSCGPVPGEEKCDTEKAKLCQLCSPVIVPSDESVFRCNPQPGDLFCGPENAQVCGCASRWLGEEDSTTAPSIKKPSSQIKSATCAALQTEQLGGTNGAKSCNVCKTRNLESSTKTDYPSQESSPASDHKTPSIYGTNKPSQQVTSLVVCNKEPGTNQCGTSNRICEECGATVNVQETYKITGTACGKCPAK